MMKLFNFYFVVPNKGCKLSLFDFPKIDEKICMIRLNRLKLSLKNRGYKRGGG